jgi:hypothetical protein
LFQLLNIVAENQELFNHDKGKKTEKLRVLFALLCLQTGFEKLYIYLSNNLYDLDKELFVLLTDPEMIENDERLQSLRESIGNVDKKYFNKLSSFIEVFYNAVQFDFDDDDDDLSDDELDIIRMLISFSGVTSTDSSGIDSNVAMPKKYTKVRMSGIDTFVKNMREIELESGTKFKGVELAVKVYELAREIFDENDVTYNFTSNGVITISYNKAKGAKKNFIYMDARKVKFLKIFFFNNGKIDWFDVNNKISDFNEINEELKSRMKMAFDCFSGKNI